MPSPAVQTRATSATTTVQTSHTVTLPSGIASGDLLIIVFGYAVTGNSVSFPGGWTQFSGYPIEQATGGTEGLTAAWRKADGTEGASITVTTTVGTRVSSVALRITGHEDPATQPPQISTGATGANANADPDAITPTGGSKDYLFIACGANSIGGAYSAAPTNYSNLQTVASGTGGGQNTMTGTGERALTASTDDPGAFTGADAAAEWAAMTIAVHPATAVVQPPRYGFVNHGHPGVL